MRTPLKQQRWLAFLVVAPMLIMTSAAVAYDPGDFDVVVSRVYNPGTFTVNGGQEWLITSSGGLTGYNVANIGTTTDGLIVVLGQLELGSWSYVGRNGGTGTVTVDDSGALSTSGWLVMARDSGAVGELEILDGTATIGGNVMAPYGANGTATITQSGGTSTWAGRIYLGGAYSDGDGQIAISGGTATFNGQVDVGRSTGTAAARFEVIGADATITVAGSLYVYDGATLGFTIGSSGVSKINVTSDTTYLNGGTVEITLDGYTPSYLETFDLIESDGISISNLDLAAVNEDVWELQVSAGGDKLQAVYIVEDDPYDPGDFDVVISTVYNPGNFTVNGDASWLITDTGGLTGYNVANIGNTTDGWVVVLGDLELGSWSYIGRNGGTGTVTVDADGSLSTSGWLAMARDSGAVGELEILDGTATIGGNVMAPYGANGTAAIIQADGTSTWAGRIYLGGAYGDGDGQIAISGGTATFNGQVDVGRSTGTATARFDVIGADATITVAGSLYVYDGATLGFTIGSSGVSKIDVTSNATYLNGGTVEITLDGYTPSTNETFDLIESDSINISNLELAVANQADWTLQVSAGGDKLQAVYDSDGPPPPGTTYYIDYVGGLDSNNGTSKLTAWKRHPYMQNFGGSYTPGTGDTFIFKGGVTWPSECFGLIIQYGGTSTAPHVYTVDQTWYSGGSWSRPVFDMQEQTIVGNRPVHFDGASYVTLDNIEIKNQRIWGTNAWSWGGIHVAGGSNVTISNCYVHSWYVATPTVTPDQNYGGLFIWGCDDAVVDSCVIHGQEVSGFSGKYSGIGIWCNNGATILDCDIYDTPNGLHMSGGSTVSGCEVHHVYTSYDSDTNVLTPTNGRHANGVYVFGSGTFCNSFVHDIIAPGAPVVFPAAGWGGESGTCTLYNNIIHGNIHLNGDGLAAVNTATYHIYNNIVTDDGNKPIVASYKNSNLFANVYIKNNILIALGTYPAPINLAQGVANLVIDNNVYYAPSALNRVDGEPCVLQLQWLTPTRYNLAGSQVLGYNANSYLSPSAIAWDYVPSSSSDIGVDDGADLSSFLTTDCLGVSRPQGDYFDIGAYEYEQ